MARGARDAALVGSGAARRTARVDRRAAGKQGQGVGGAAVAGEGTEEGVGVRQVAWQPERTGSIAGEVVARRTETDDAAAIAVGAAAGGVEVAGHDRVPEPDALREGNPDDEGGIALGDVDPGAALAGGVAGDGRIDDRERTGGGAPGVDAGPNPDSVPGRSARDTAVLPVIVVFTTRPPESKRMPAASSPLLPLTTLSLMVRKENG